MAVESEKLSLLMNDLTLLENYAEDLFTFAPLPTLSISPLKVIFEFNPAFEELSGYSSKEIIGRKIKVLFGKKEATSLVEEAKTKKKIEGKEMILITSKRQEIPVNVFVKLRTGDQGKIGGFFISAYDLREIKRIEQEIKKTNAALRTKVREQKKELKKLAQSLEQKVEQRSRTLKQKIKQLEETQRKVVSREMEMVNLKKENRKLEKKISKLQSSS